MRGSVAAPDRPIGAVDAVMAITVWIVPSVAWGWRLVGAGWFGAHAGTSQSNAVWPLTARSQARTFGRFTSGPNAR